MDGARLVPIDLDDGSAGLAVAAPFILKRRPLRVSDHAVVRRAPQRASYDRTELDAVLDVGKVCHVAIHDDRPVIIPMAYARDGDRILLHGSTKSRLMRHIASGAPVCIAVTHLDGLVLARSVFNHTMNYRSAVVFGRGRVVEGAQKGRALEMVTEHLAPGRWNEARRPNDQEDRATLVVAVDIEEFSLKSRSGPPADDEDPGALDVWSGVIELRQEWIDPRLA